MTTFVALLRGVNVGGHRKVPMLALREACVEAGFSDVRTYIQSGNVVLGAPGKVVAVTAKLEDVIRKTFGFPVDVIARTATAWSAYVAANPLVELSRAEPNRVMLLVCAKPPKAEAVHGLRSRATLQERVEAAGDAIWIHYPKGAGTSKISGALVDRLVGSAVTVRNWTTVLTLDAMAREPGPT